MADKFHSGVPTDHLERFGGPVVAHRFHNPHLGRLAAIAAALGAVMVSSSGGAIVGDVGGGGGGSQGAQGAQGAPGVQGSPGNQGANGNQGTAGSSGTQGAAGSQGLGGPQGSAGSPGSQGLAGPQGNPGSQGLGGPQGSAGSPGSQGANGAQGLAGPQGNPGSQGAAGSQGSAGSPGTQGANGAQGSAGAQGASGNQGPNGAQGPTGTQGLIGPQGAAPAATPTLLLGIATGAVNTYTSGQLTTMMQQIAASGAQWVRFGARWSSTETSSGVFNWTAIDPAVSAAVAAGLNVCFIIDAGAGPGWITSPFTNLATFNTQTAGFCTAAVNRYSVGPYNVHTWEYINEPNLVTNAHQYSCPVASQYANNLVSAYAAIHAADSLATVISGGLSPATVAQAGQVAVASNGASVASLTTIAFSNSAGAAGVAESVLPASGQIYVDTLVGGVLQGTIFNYTGNSAGVLTGVTLQAGASATGTLYTGGRIQITGHAVDPANWLAQMYLNGAHGAMDAVGMHPYTWPDSSLDYGGGFATFYNMPWWIYNQMQANGDGGKKVWCTEFGWPTAITSGFITQNQQATYLQQVLTQLDLWPWVSHAFLYDWSDAVGPADGFGLLDASGNQKVAYAPFVGGTVGPNVGPQGAQGPAGSSAASVVAKTANYTVLTSDSGSVLTFNGNSLVAKLPAAAPAMPWSVQIFNVSLTGQIVTVNPNGPNLGGSTNLVLLNGGQGLQIYSDGVNYQYATSLNTGMLDFEQAVRLNSPDQLAPLSSNFNANSQRIIQMANGIAPQDAATVSQTLYGAGAAALTTAGAAGLIGGVNLALSASVTTNLVTTSSLPVGVYLFSFTMAMFNNAALATAATAGFTFGNGGGAGTVAGVATVNATLPIIAAGTLFTSVTSVFVLTVTTAGNFTIASPASVATLSVGNANSSWKAVRIG